MEAINKSLTKISELLAKINLKLKVPSLPKLPSAPKPPKMPGVAPTSKKNPIKVAEQKQDNPQVKADLAQVKMKEAGKWQEKLKMSKNGQWSLTKNKS